VGGVDISDHAALRGAVERAGLVLPLRVWEAVEASGDITEAELPDRLRALEVELDGVPRIVVGGTIVPAWIDLDDVRARLRSAITAAAATPA
jgi:hypothetical protein